MKRRIDEMDRRHLAPATRSNEEVPRETVSSSRSNDTVKRFKGLCDVILTRCRDKSRKRVLASSERRSTFSKERKRRWLLSWTHL